MEYRDTRMYKMTKLLDEFKNKYQPIVMHLYNQDDKIHIYFYQKTTFVDGKPKKLFDRDDKLYDFTEKFINSIKKGNFNKNFYNHYLKRTGFRYIHIKSKILDGIQWWFDSGAINDKLEGITFDDELFDMVINAPGAFIYKYTNLYFLISIHTRNAVGWQDYDNEIKDLETLINKLEY